MTGMRAVCCLMPLLLSLLPCSQALPLHNLAIRARPEPNLSALKALPIDTTISVEPAQWSRLTYKIIEEPGEATRDQVYNVNKLVKGREPQQVALRLENFGEYNHYSIKYTRVYRDYEVHRYIAEHSDPESKHPRMPTGFMDMPALPEPFMWSSNKQEQINMYVVQERPLMGKSLEESLKDYDGHIDNSHMLLDVGAQMLDRLQTLHEQKFNVMHGNIEPSNILLPKATQYPWPTTATLVLSGFDVASAGKWHVKKAEDREEEGKEAAAKAKTIGKALKVIGDIRYASVAALRGIKVGPGDDVENLGWVLVGLGCGLKHVPWKDVKGNEEGGRAAILDMKLNIIKEALEHSGTEKEERQLCADMLKPEANKAVLKLILYGHQRDSMQSHVNYAEQIKTLRQAAAAPPNPVHSG